MSPVPASLGVYPISSSSLRWNLFLQSVSRLPRCVQLSWRSSYLSHPRLSSSLYPVVLSIFLKPPPPRSLLFVYAKQFYPDRFGSLSPLDPSAPPPLFLVCCLFSSPLLLSIGSIYWCLCWTRNRRVPLGWSCGMSLLNEANPAARGALPGQSQHQDSSGKVSCVLYHRFIPACG